MKGLGKYLLPNIFGGRELLTKSFFLLTSSFPGLFNTLRQYSSVIFCFAVSRTLSKSSNTNKEIRNIFFIRTIITTIANVFYFIEILPPLNNTLSNLESPWS